MRPWDTGQSWKLFDLGQDYAALNGLVSSDPLSPTKKRDTQAAVMALKGEDTVTFYEMLAQITIGTPRAAALVKQACDHGHVEETA